MVCPQIWGQRVLGSSSLCIFVLVLLQIHEPDRIIMFSKIRHQSWNECNIMYVTYLEVLAQCLVDEWCSFLSIGEEEHFGCGYVFLHECFVIIACNFNWSIRVESSCDLLQVFCLELPIKLQILRRCWECWVYADSWQWRQSLFIAECFELLAVECPNSEYAFILGGKALVFRLNGIWLTIYK